MTGSTCDVGNPNFTYSYCPSIPAAILFAVLFSVTTIGHVYQAIQHRKPFFGILIMAGLWEIAGYVFRVVSIQNPFSIGLNAAQMLLILLAPLWINAFIYMLVGRMIHFFLDDDRIFGIKARKITLIFVVFDFIAFTVQGTGGSMTSSTDLNVIKTGLNVYTAGVALQVLFNATFLAIIGRFHQKARATLPTSASDSQEMPMDTYRTGQSTSSYSFLHTFKEARYLLIVVYVITTLILFRNFYRLAEFASGVDNTIIRHEWYAYVFDAVPMLIAMLVLNAFYPGRKLKGARSDFSEENRQRKTAQKEKREKREKKKSAKKTAAAAAANGGQAYSEVSKQANASTISDVSSDQQV